MGKKINQLANEKAKAIEKLRELEELENLAKQEEDNLLFRVSDNIKDLCNANKVFCGAILNTNDILAIVKLAIESKELIKIPFKVYITE